jgi:hypothetical protein
MPFSGKGVKTRPPPPPPPPPRLFPLFAQILLTLTAFYMGFSQFKYVVRYLFIFLISLIFPFVPFPPFLIITSTPDIIFFMGGGGDMDLRQRQKDVKGYLEHPYLRCADL